MVLLVQGGEEIAVVIDRFDFQLVVFAIDAGRGSEADGVLVAQEGRDGIENFVHLAFEAREPGVAAGHFSEGIKLVFGLQVIHLGKFGSGQTLFVNTQSIQEFAHAHAENGGVGFFEMLEGLVESVFAESVVAGGDDQNRFFAFHVAKLIEGFEHGVEEDGFVKIGPEEAVDGLGDLAFVLGEID